MEISVVIPVYNAEKYVTRAVESALQQKECAEVILVEDRSPDNSFEVCKDLSDRFKKVFLYQHEKNQNKGAGPSRNLGAEKARFDYIAFLDADDFYLPGRFKKAAKLLSNDPHLDGIYEPVGCCFETEDARQRYFATHSKEVAMVTKKVEPEELFECLIEGKNGYIHLDGLLIKKKAFFDAGMFPPLKLHQDTVLMFKLSLLCRLAPGEMENPVSMRLLHMNNRITKPGIDFLQTRYLSFENLLTWMIRHNIVKKKNLVQARYYHFKYRLLKKKRRFLMAIFYYIYYRSVFKKYAFWLKG